MESAWVCLELVPLILNGQPTGYQVCGAWALLDDAAFMGFEGLGITGQSLSAAFGWGFGTVILFWALGYGIGVVRSVINRL